MGTRMVIEPSHNKGNTYYMLLASFVAAIDSLKPACSSDTNKLVDECCASQETTYDYATNPLACLTTNGKL